MRASYSEFLDRLSERLRGEGHLSAAIRATILEGRILDEPLNAFVLRVRANASAVTQAHIEELKASGFSEDQIFEAAVCAAFVAGSERWEAASKAIGQKTSEATDAP